MGNAKETPYGKVVVGERDALFEELAARIENLHGGPFNRIVGLSGGSTPKAFYAWAAARKPFSARNLKRTVWTASDERFVPLESEESNFGVADRALLTPLGVGERQKLPWPVMLDPHSAAASFTMRWNERFGPDRGLDLCLLGMGDDGHTASIFPESPLLSTPIHEPFTCVDVPGKGWRLTITRVGLARCGEIVVTVMGEGKASILAEVLEGPPERFPIQMVLGELKDRVTWLVDPAAAAKLS